MRALYSATEKERKGGRKMPPKVPIHLYGEPDEMPEGMTTVWQNQQEMLDAQALPQFPPPEQLPEPSVPEPNAPPPAPLQSFAEWSAMVAQSIMPLAWQQNIGQGVFPSKPRSRREKGIPPPQPSAAYYAQHHITPNPTLNPLFVSKKVKKVLDGKGKLTAQDLRDVSRGYKGVVFSKGKWGSPSWMNEIAKKFAKLNSEDREILFVKNTQKELLRRKRAGEPPLTEEEIDGVMEVLEDVMTLTGSSEKKKFEDELSGGNLPAIPKVPKHLLQLFSVIEQRIREKSKKEEDVNLAESLMLREVATTLNSAVHGTETNEGHKNKLRLLIRYYMGAGETPDWKGGFRLYDPGDLNYQLLTYANDGIFTRGSNGSSIPRITYVGQLPPANNRFEEWVQARINNDIERILVINNTKQEPHPANHYSPFEVIHYYISAELDEFYAEPRSAEMTRVKRDAYAYVETLKRHGAGNNGGVRPWDGDENRTMVIYHRLKKMWKDVGRDVEEGADWVKDTQSQDGWITESKKPWKYLVETLVYYLDQDQLDACEGYILMLQKTQTFETVVERVFELWSRGEMFTPNVGTHPWTTEEGNFKSNKYSQKKHPEGKGRPASFVYSSKDLTPAQKAKERAAFYRTEEFKQKKNPPEKKKFEPEVVKEEPEVKDVEVHKALMKEGKTPAEADAILAKLARTLKEGKVKSFLKKFVGHKNAVANAKFRKQSKKEIAEYNFKIWKAKDGTVHTIIHSKEFKSFLKENGIAPSRSEEFFEHLKLMTYEDLSKESGSFFKQHEVRTPTGPRGSTPMSQWRYNVRREQMYDTGEGIEGVYNTRVRELASKYFEFSWTPPRYNPNKRVA